MGPHERRKGLRTTSWGDISDAVSWRVDEVHVLLKGHRDTPLIKLVDGGQASDGSAILTDEVRKEINQIRHERLTAGATSAKGIEPSQVHKGEVIKVEGRSGLLIAGLGPDTLRFTIPNSAPGCEGGYIAKIKAPYEILSINITKLSFSGGQVGRLESFAAAALVVKKTKEQIKENLQTGAGFAAVFGKRFDLSPIVSALEGKTDADFSYVPEGSVPDKSRTIEFRKAEPVTIVLTFNDLKLKVPDADIMVTISGEIILKTRELLWSPLKPKE